MGCARGLVIDLGHNPEPAVADFPGDDLFTPHERARGLPIGLHPRKCVVRRSDEGLPFLGYVVRPDRIRVRGATVRRFRRRLHKRPAGSDDRAQSLAAWQGHVRLAGSFRTLGRLGA